MTVTSPGTRPAQGRVVVRARPGLLALPAVRFGTTTAALAAVACVVVLAHVAVLPAEVLLVAVAGIGCAPLPRRLAAAAGVLAWAWATGFAENAYGDLTFSSADLTRLAGAVAGAVLLATVTRRARGVAAAHWSRGPSHR
jgi:hypothetical protein